MILYRWLIIYTLISVRCQNWAKLLLYMEKHTLLDFYLFQTVSICCHYDFVFIRRIISQISMSRRGL